MDNLFDTSLEFTRWLQNNYPQLEGFFLAVSSAGREEFYLALLPLVYWCINKHLGKLLGYLLFVSMALNTTLKQAARGPRPFWIDPSVGIEETAGYGIPSGHAQYATTLYLMVAAFVGAFWIWIVALLLIFVISLSRIYLGAHFIHDVLAGFLVALPIVAIALLWEQRFSRQVSKRILGQRMLLALLVVVVLTAVYGVATFLISRPDMSAAWADFIPAAEIASTTEMATAVGALLGFSVGIVLESSRVRFRADGPIGKRVARYVLGIIVTIIIWQGLGAVFPRDPLVVALPLRIFRYFLLTLWAAYYAPWLFARLGLAETDPMPQMDMRM